MLDRSNFLGIFVIAVTPFLDDSAVDERGFARTMQFCRDAKVHGVVANAIASEGFYLDRDERRRVGEIVVREMAGTVPTVIAVSATHWRIAAGFARDAEELGADAIMSLPPGLATPDEVRDYYRALSGETALPIVLQNWFGPGATTMSPQLIAELVNELPNARFVKEESPYPAQSTGEIIRLAGDRLHGVMGGRAGKTLMEEVRHGVAGTMPACEIADVHVALWNAIEARDEKLSRKIFQRLLPLIDLEGSYGMPLMKEVLRMRGVIGAANVRQPGFRNLDRHALDEAALIMDDLAEWMLPAYPHRTSK
jgi:dihydrodipicolinate synthase/N-acetylneuraminate lyase